MTADGPAVPDRLGVEVAPPSAPVGAVRVREHVVDGRERVGQQRELDGGDQLLGVVEGAQRREQPIGKDAVEAGVAVVTLRLAMEEADTSFSL